jgi:hypothetical protein
VKVIIAGSRNIIAYPGLIQRAVEQSNFKVHEVVSGTARGIDRLGECWAVQYDKPIRRFPADWDNLGKSAGFRRNEQMADYADALIAVWDGQSNGTKHMISQMTLRGKPVFVFTP